MREAAEWYRLAQADAERSAVACAAALDAVVTPHERKAAQPQLVDFDPARWRVALQPVAAREASPVPREAA
jgi:hypothetical protein